MIAKLLTLLSRGLDLIARGMQCAQMPSLCDHLKHAGNPKPLTPEGCEECLKTGDEWVHLRRCLTCGHIGCCDDSKNKHATKHFHKTKHPVIQSFQPGEDWKWCFVDEIFQE